jgi:hypothetical protein
LKLGLFENRVLRRISETKRNVAPGGPRRLSYEELHNLCALPDIVRMIKSWRMRLAGRAAGKMRKAYRILDGNSEGKKALR